MFVAPKPGDKYVVRGGGNYKVYTVRDYDWISDQVIYQDDSGSTDMCPGVVWMQAFEPYVELSFGNQPSLFDWAKCECGVDTVGYGLHSSYCPKYNKEQ